jgi:hypothetical protein
MQRVYEERQPSTETVSDCKHAKIEENVIGLKAW